MFLPGGCNHRLVPSVAVITAAVDHAVVTAVLDDVDRCRFDPEALRAVLRLCTSGRSRDAVIEVVDEALRKWIEGLDPDRVLVAVVLRERVEAGTDRKQVPVMNLRGDA